MRLGKITQAAWNRSVRKPLKKSSVPLEKWHGNRNVQNWNSRSRGRSKVRRQNKIRRQNKSEDRTGRMTVWSTASAGGKNANVGAYAVIKAAGELASQKVMAEGVSNSCNLPEQMQEEDVKHLTDTAGELCKK